jgi:hypothetical protein
VVGANSVTLGNRTNICLSTCARSSAPFAITSRVRPAALFVLAQHKVERRQIAATAAA